MKNQSRVGIMVFSKTHKHESSMIQAEVNWELTHLAPRVRL